MQSRASCPFCERAPLKISVDDIGDDVKDVPGEVCCRQTSPVPPLFWTTTQIPTPTDTLALSKFLDPEEQVADLVDDFGVSTRLTTRKALIGSENKI